MDGVADPITPRRGREPGQAVGQGVEPGRSSSALAVGWYRFRATLGRKWTGYVALVALIGLLGGLAMGSIAGARRTLGSPAVYIASTVPDSFGIGTGVLGVTSPTTGYDPTVADRIEHLPGVDYAGTVLGVNVVVLDREGVPFPINAQAGNGSTSVDDTYFTKDKLSVLQGRIPGPPIPTSSPSTPSWPRPSISTWASGSPRDLHQRPDRGPGLRDECPPAPPAPDGHPHRDRRRSLHHRRRPGRQR